MKKTTIVLLLLLAASFVNNLCGSEQQIIKISGDRQMGIVGFPLKDDFVVKVVSAEGEPVAGAEVGFFVLGQTLNGKAGSKKNDVILKRYLCITDSLGIARTSIQSSSLIPGEILISASTRNTIERQVVFSSNMYSKHWILNIVIGLMGGLGLFLFGMFYLNAGLQKAAGHKLRGVLITFTASRLRGVVTGFIVTLFNQSSAATTLLEVSLVGAGLLSFYQTMAVTMGAEIGSTITAQLIAFNFSEYAVPIAGLGFYISFFSKTKKWKRIGDMILGFGVLFIGIKIMSDLFMPMRDYGPFKNMMERIENPLYGIMIGMIFTILIHSSGATAGIVIALALAGAITLWQAVLINLGAQIGTCVTAVMGSVGRGREGKRVALWHIIHQTSGVLLILPFLVFIEYKGEPSYLFFVKWFTSDIFGTTDLARQIAVAHTFAAIFNAIIFLPFLPLISKFLYHILPRKEKDRAFGPIYIDEVFFSTPYLALEQAKKEIQREGEIVLDMMRGSLRAFETLDLKLCETVSLKDIRVDVLHNAVVPYLAKIPHADLSEEQINQETMFLYITADLESVGDVIDKNIMPLARKKIENNLWFSDEGWKDIVDLHSRVLKNLENVLDALRDDNIELAKLISESNVEIDRYESELRKRHIGRLHSGLQESLETSSVHLDLIDQFKRINSHIATVALSLTGKI